VRSASKLVLLGLLLAAMTLALVALPSRDWLAVGVAWVDAHRRFAWAVFVAAYVVATVLVIPGSLLTLAAGFVFGLPFGVALVSAGSTLGACGAFLIGRYLARGWVRRRIRARTSFRALESATQHEGFVIVLLARLSPVFPFNLLNYGLALTAVRFRDYTLASWLGMLPATVLYVYIGTAASDLSELKAGELEGGIGARVLLLGGLAATVLLTALITRMATRTLGQRLERELHENAEAQ
jgi:uncharacterized membrane protein YdjX (TVP38/TMEM64 family)